MFFVSIMQRLKKGTMKGNFWVQKKLKKKHQMGACFGIIAYKSAYFIGQNRRFLIEK